MDDQVYSPVTIEVVWDNPDPEIRALSAMLAILERCKEDRMDEAALHRVTNYISERFPEPPF